jgi:hypothetical protein
VPSGNEVVLSGAWELDDTPGAEAVHAFFCARPLEGTELESVRAALAARPQATPPLPRDAGCTTDKLGWTTVRRP